MGLIILGNSDCCSINLSFAIAISLAIVTLWDTVDSEKVIKCKKYLSRSDAELRIIRPYESMSIRPVKQHPIE